MQLWPFANDMGVIFRQWSHARSSKAIQACFHVFVHNNWGQHQAVWWIPKIDFGIRSQVFGSGIRCDRRSEYAIFTRFTYWFEQGIHSDSNSPCCICQGSTRIIDPCKLLTRNILWHWKHFRGPQSGGFVFSNGASYRCQNWCVDGRWYCLPWYVNITGSSPLTCTCAFSKDKGM